MALLDTGKCDINLQSRRGFTPLMVAVWKGELECCEKLIELGAKLYMKDTGAPPLEEQSGMRDKATNASW